MSPIFWFINLCFMIAFIMKIKEYKQFIKKEYKPMMQGLEALKDGDIEKAFISFKKYEGEEEPLIYLVNGMAYLEGAGTLVDKIKAREEFEKIENFSYPKNIIEKNPKLKDSYYKIRKKKKSKEDTLKTIKDITREIWKEEELWRITFVKEL